MRLKVRVKNPYTSDELAQLISLGCEEKPFIERGEEALFAATDGHTEQLQALPCVLSVEPMPTYSVGFGW